MIHTFAVFEASYWCDSEDPIIPPTPNFHSVDSGTRHVLTFRTLAVEGVDPVDALAIVQAGLAGALIRVDLAEDALVP